MKELSIEEKAKVYDKVLKWIHDLYSILGIDTKEKAENIFPEPYESEDERIRTGLINGFNECLKKSPYPKNAQKYWHNIKIEDIFSWLEKQGEPIKVNPTEFDLRLNRLLKQFESLPKEELASSLNFYLNVVQNNGTYKQKPTDEDMKEALRTEYEKGRADAFAQMQKEWSKEDESIALGIEQIVNCASLLNIAPDKLDKVRNWLKSLKERYTWKPSDAQMRALEYIINNASNTSYSCKIAKELLEQLRRLKGE